MGTAKAKNINYSNLDYISTSKHKRNGGIGHLRGKLRYFQYRNDKSDHVPHPRGKARPGRWRDMGLGSHYGEILKSCQALQSEHVLAWTWVISPAPDLMVLVPEGERRGLVRELTESVVNEYYDARGVDVPAYSYVLHDRDTEAGEQQLHTHVVLPGLVETVMGQQPFYNNERQGHVDLFNRIADKQFELALDRTIGQEWRALRPERDQTREEAIESELDLWFGPRDAAPDFEPSEAEKRDMDRYFGPDL